MMDLKSGFVWSGFSQLGQTLVQLFSIFIFARLLTPNDFGTISIIAIFISIGNMMVDSGMGGALLRLKSPKNIDFSTLFLYNIFIGLFLYFLFFIIAPYFALYYELPILNKLLRVLAIVIVLNAFGIVQYTKLIIDLKFKLLAFITLSSSFASFVFALVAALFNVGLWALVVQQISFSFIYNLLLWYNIRYIPTLNFSKESFKIQTSFGLSILGSNILSSIAENLNNNIVAKIVPLNQTGYFSQSNRLVFTLDGAIKSVFDKVLFPILAKLDESKVLVIYYLNIFKHVISFVFPLSAFISLASFDLIIILLGEQWIGSAWMLKVLSLCLIPLIVITLCRNFFKTIGKTNFILINEVIRFFIVLSSLFISSIFGLKYVVASVLLSLSITCFINVLYVSKSLDLNFFHLPFQIFKSLMPSVLSYISTFILFEYINISNVYFDLIITFCIFSLLLILFSLLTRQYELFNLVRKSIKV